MVIAQIQSHPQRPDNASQLTMSVTHDKEPEKTIPMPPTRGVQSMLKTATEIGDLEWFTVCPPKVPRTGSRIQRIRPPSSSSDSLFPPVFRYQRSLLANQQKWHSDPRSTTSLPGMSSQETIHSDLAHYHQDPRSRRHMGHRQYSTGLEKFRDIGPAVRSRPSRRSVRTLQSQNGPPPTRSSSPRVYQVPTQNPVDRSTSPLIRDIQSRRSDRRLKRYLRYKGASLRGSALALGVNGHQRDSCLPPEINNSITSSVRVTPSSSPSVPVADCSTRLPSRVATPQSDSPLHPRVQSSLSPQSASRITKSSGRAKTPYYYDYTEPFLDKQYFSPSNGYRIRPLPPNPKGIILENAPQRSFSRAQMQSRTRQDLVLQPSELPGVDSGQGITQSKTQTEYCWPNENVENSGQCQVGISKEKVRS